MSKESVEEFLARGGEITHVPRGLGKETLKVVRANDGRRVYADGVIDFQSYVKRSENFTERSKE